MHYQGSRQRGNPCGSVDFREPQRPVVVRGRSPALPPQAVLRRRRAKDFWTRPACPTGWSCDCQRQEQRTSKKPLPACEAGRRRRSEARGKCALLTCRWFAPRRKWRFPATPSGLRVSGTFKHRAIDTFAILFIAGCDEQSKQGVGKFTATTQAPKKLQWLLQSTLH